MADGPKAGGPDDRFRWSMKAHLSPAPALPFDYVRRTRSLPVNLLFLMPWLMLYQVALFFTRSPVDNAAAAWFRALFHALGRRGSILATLLVALALALVVIVRVREATRDKGIFGGMLIEGLCYGALLGTVASMLAATLPMGPVVALAGGHGTAATPVAAASVGGSPAVGVLGGLQHGFRELGLAMGAGIFEELVFRGVLLAGIYALLVHAIGTDRYSAGFVAIVVSAYVFSDYHHWGVTGEPYVAHVFAFRFHAGVLLGGIFLFRGLGIAALAHGFYDAIVLLS